MTVDSEVRQKFEAWQSSLTITEHYSMFDAFEAGMRAGEIAMKEKAAELVRTKGNELGYRGTVAAIRALPLSGAE